MKKTSKKFPLRKAYAIGHILLVAICLVVCLLFFKHWFLAVVFYVIANMMLPTLLKFMTQIGNYYEVESYTIDDEGNATPVFGDFSYRYGLFSSLRDTIVAFLVGYFLCLLVYSLLPPIVGSFMAISCIFILFANYLIYPLIVDVVQLTSDEDPSEMLAAKKKSFFRLLIVSSLVFSVAAAIILPLAARATLNANRVVADYYEDWDKRNLLANVDLNDASKTHDDLYLRCKIKYEGDVTIAENYAFPGCEISMSFHPIKLKWEIKELSLLGQGKFTGPVTFEGEAPEGTCGAKGTAQLTVCFDSADAGTLTFKDNATGEELLATSFVMDKYNAFWKGYKMVLQDDVRAFFGVADFFFCIENNTPEQATIRSDLVDGFVLTLQQ